MVYYNVALLVYAESIWPHILRTGSQVRDLQ